MRGQVDTMSERKVLLMRDPRAVVLAIAHSEEAKRHRRNKHDSRNTPPDVRDSSARSGSVSVWIRKHFDAICAEIAFRYEWFDRVLRKHTQVEIAFFEELKSDVEPWMRLIRFFGVCANESDVRAILQANNVAALKKRGYTVARKGEIESFRRELRPQLVAELNRRSARILQPELIRRFGIGRELRLQGGPFSKCPRRQQVH